MFKLKKNIHFEGTSGLKMKFCALVIATLLVVGFVQANPPNFNYDFSGFTKLTQMLATSCSDIEGQVSPGANPTKAF